MKPTKSILKLTALGAFAVLAACGGNVARTGSESVSATASAVTVGATAGAVQAFTSMDGTYGAGCTDRAGAWSLPLNGFLGALTNSPLTVVQNNTTCVLTLVDVQDFDAAKVYVAIPPIVLTGVQSIPTLFGAAPDISDFSGSAIQSDVTYAADFTITLQHSDVPTTGVDTNVTPIVVVNGSAVTSTVPSPDYTLTDSILVTLDPNLLGSVVSTTGNLVLNPGVTAAQGWVVVLPETTHGALGSFAEDDWMFTTVPAISTGVPGTPITPAQLGLVPGVVLPYSVVLVLQNDGTGGVVSYESFQITFVAL